MTIPAYPIFRPLEITDLNVFNEAFKVSPPAISEFTFTNLYAWREAYKFQVAILDNFIIVCSEAKGQKRFFCPIGSGNVKVVMERILDDTKGIFIRIPEAAKLLFDGDSRFKIELDMDNSDYLFKTADLVTLPGRKYDGKRNLMHKFKSIYKYEYIKLTMLNVSECLEFEQVWCSVKNCDSIEGLDNERRAIREMVGNFSAFDIIGGAIKVDGKIRAIAIGQRLNPDTLVVHILKADADMAGLYQVMNNEFFLNEGSDFEYVNMEQDLGIEGLRKAKLSYHPVNRIEKFKISKV